MFYPVDCWVRMYPSVQLSCLSLKCWSNQCFMLSTILTIFLQSVTHLIHCNITKENLRLKVQLQHKHFHKNICNTKKQSTNAISCVSASKTPTKRLFEIVCGMQLLFSVFQFQISSLISCLNRVEIELSSLHNYYLKFGKVGIQNLMPLQQLRNGVLPRAFGTKRAIRRHLLREDTILYWYWFLIPLYVIPL